MSGAPARARHRRGSPGRTRRHAWPPLAGVLVLALAGLGLVVSGRLFAGGVVIGVALLVAGGLRLLLPERLVGLLAVRSKTLDVLMLGLLGGGVLLLTTLVHVAR